MGEEDRIEALAHGLLQNHNFDEDAAYFKRGQPYTAESDDVVKARWVEYFKKLIDQHTNDENMIFSDCCAELRRRGVEEPIHEVQEELAKLQEHIREDPDNPGVQLEVAKFMDKMRKPDA